MSKGMANKYHTSTIDVPYQRFFSYYKYQSLERQVSYFFAQLYP